MIIAIWVASTAPIAFCLYLVVRRVYYKGYEAGARKVLEEWKTTLNQSEDDINGKL